MKRVLAILLAVMLMVMVVGCGQSASGTTDTGSVPAADATDDVTLTVWHLWEDPTVEPQGASYNNAVEIFNSQDNGINIDTQAFSNTNGAYVTKLQTAAAGGELPDIVFCFGGSKMQPYVEAGYFLPLNDYLSDDFNNKVLEGSVTNSTFDGNIYGLSTGNTPAFLICNTGLFEQAGLEIPKTYEDLMNCINVFNANGITPFALGNAERWECILYFEQLLVQLVGQEKALAMVSGEESFDNPDVVKAAQMLLDMVEAKAFNEDANSATYADGSAIFTQGNAAMMFTGSWDIATLEGENSLVKDQLSVAYFPEVTGGAGSQTDIWGAPFSYFCINANTEHPEEAVEFLEALSYNQEQQSYYSGVAFPTYKMDDLDESKITSKLSGEFYELMNGSTSMTAGWDNLFEASVAESYKDLVTSLIGNAITAEDFARNLAEVVGGQ